MPASTPRTTDLIHQLTSDACEAEGEGQAWEAATARACVLYLQTLERAHALEAEAARAKVLELLVEAGERQPLPRVQPKRPAREGLH